MSYNGFGQARFVAHVRCLLDCESTRTQISIAAQEQFSTHHSMRAEEKHYVTSMHKVSADEMIV